MQISEGNIGRVIVIRFDDGEDLIECAVKAIKEKNVKSGIMFFIGALKSANLVVGPKEPTPKPEPVWFSFDDAREVVGIATIFEMNGEPKLHLHTATGRGTEGVLGCIRNKSEIYLTIEAVILEFVNMDVIRKFYPELGFAKMYFGKE